MSAFILTLLFVAILALAVIAFLLLRIWRTVHWSYRTRMNVESLRNALSHSRQQEEARDYLLRLLQLERGDLPPMGGWAASADFLLILAEHILAHKPQTVVEFGSGVSTLVAARCLQLNGSGRLVSYDHDAVFAGITRQRATRLSLSHDVRPVAVMESTAYGYAGKWYAAEDCPDTVDLIVIDGPPMAFHPETRGAAGPAIFPRLSTQGAILLDDAARPGERAIVERWRKEFPDITFTFIATDKGTVIGSRA